MRLGNQPDPRLARVLRRMREELGESQEDLALEADMTTSGYARIERGLAEPGWTTVCRIAEALGVSLEELGREVERSDE